MKPFEKRPIAWRRVADLCIHPAVEHDPRLKPNDARYLAMQAAWREAGTLPPLYVTRDGQIVDGRHKWWFAQNESIDEVPCIEVDQEEVTTVVLSALMGRNHITKQQRAYLAAPKLEAAFEAAHQRRLDILKSGGRVTDPGGKSIDQFAAQLCMSGKLLVQARNLHQSFTLDTKFDFSSEDGGKRKLTLREYFEPRILADEDPMSLGDALKGVGFKLSPLANQVGARSKIGRNSHLSHVLSWWRHSKRISRHWEALPPEGRDQVVAKLQEHIAVFPVDFLTEIGRCVRASIKAKQTARDEDAE